MGWGASFLGIRELLWASLAAPLPLPPTNLGARELCKVSGEMGVPGSSCLNELSGTFLHRTSEVTLWPVLCPSMKKRRVGSGFCSHHSGKLMLREGERGSLPHPDPSQGPQWGCQGPSCQAAQSDSDTQASHCLWGSWVCPFMRNPL